MEKQLFFFIYISSWSVGIYESENRYLYDRLSMLCERSRDLGEPFTASFRCIRLYVKCNVSKIYAYFALLWHSGLSFYFCFFFFVKGKL